MPRTKKRRSTSSAGSNKSSKLKKSIRSRKSYERYNRGDSSAPSSPSTSSDSGDERSKKGEPNSGDLGEYVVEKIESKKIVSGDTYYRVKWLGYPNLTWEPAANLTNCPELLKECDDAYERKKTEFLKSKRISNGTSVRNLEARANRVQATDTKSKPLTNGISSVAVSQPSANPPEEETPKEKGVYNMSFDDIGTWSSSQEQCHKNKEIVQNIFDDDIEKFKKGGKATNSLTNGTHISSKRNSKGPLNFTFDSDRSSDEESVLSLPIEKEPPPQITISSSDEEDCSKTDHQSNRLDKSEEEAEFSDPGQEISISLNQKTGSRNKSFKLKSKDSSSLSSKKEQKNKRRQYMIRAVLKNEEDERHFKRCLQNIAKAGITHECFSGDIDNSLEKTTFECD